MKPLANDQIRGTWATLLLPIGEQDDIRYDELATEIDSLIQFGVDGIYSNGTAGEFYNQTEAEFDTISEMLATRCNAAGMPFQLGVSHMSPLLSLERAKRAVALKPGAIQVILPDWYPTIDEEAIRFLDRMAEFCDPIGLVLYNPPHAKRVLSMETIGRLKETIPALVGVKVADGNEAWYESMRLHATDLSIFVPGHHLATGVRSGAHGSYSNMACLHPLAAQHWYKLMKTDPVAAQEVEKRIGLFLEQYILPYITVKAYSSPAVDKLFAAIGGWSPVSTRLRWPYRSVPMEDVGELRLIAQQILPEFFMADS